MSYADTIESYRGANTIEAISTCKEMLRDAKLRHLEIQMIQEATSSKSQEAAFNVLKRYAQMAENAEKTETTPLPEGEYWFADPCLILSNEEYDELMEVALVNRWREDQFFTLKNGRNVWVLNTAHGDGHYESNKGHTLLVDTGSIAIASVLESDKDSPYQISRITMEKPFRCFSGDDDILYFGHITVNTGDELCDTCGLRHCECDDEDEYNEDDE